jgi:[ribosomal protein S5]-alanine N-acetyltransferase
MNNPYLIGESLYLRPVEREDAPRIAGWLNDPEVNRTLLRYRPIAVHQEVAWIEQNLGTAEMDTLGLGIVLKAEDRFIGVCGLHQIELRNRQAAFGLTIGEKDAWGKGYGTEVTRLLVRHGFETLNLNRIWLHVYTNNPAGVRAYEKAGFQREGVLRQSCYQGGRYWDTIVMAVLREEWNATGCPTSSRFIPGGPPLA